MLSKKIKLHKITLLLLGIGLCSCGSQSTPVDLSLFSGEWVKEGYCNELRITHSAMQASSNILHGNSGLSIAPATDSSSVLLLINNHEGMTGRIQADSIGHTPGSVRFLTNSTEEEHYEMILDSTANNKVLLLFIYNKQGEKIETDRFERVAAYNNRKDPCGLAATRQFVTGQWLRTAAQSDEKQPIEVDSLGNLSGWEGYSLLTVATDAVFGGEDQVLLSNGEGSIPQRFIAVFTPTLIELYTALEDPEGSPVEIRGTLQYTLQKK